MEVVRRFLDADILKSIIALPDSFHNRRLEVIVMPAEQDVSAKESVNVDEVVNSLLGAIPYTDMTLDELREERLGAI